VPEPENVPAPYEPTPAAPQPEPTVEPIIVAHPTAPAIASDGLPARRIKTHTLDKFDRHRKYCTIFNRGMHKLWTGNRGYLELFASSGLAVHDLDEVDACPILAAKCRPPFSRIACVEYNLALADALEQRLRRLGYGPDVARVFAGDANDPAVLAEAMDFLPRPGLNFAFIDPEDLNGDWHAIEYLASLRRRGQRIDFLINLPIGPMKRNHDKAKAITLVLGTDEWIERVDAGEPLGEVFRETYALQFRRLGFDVAEPGAVLGPDVEAAPVRFTVGVAVRARRRDADATPPRVEGRVGPLDRGGFRHQLPTADALRRAARIASSIGIRRRSRAAALNVWA
jgi:hypothetical protein